jgi:hypothetical protein
VCTLKFRSNTQQKGEIVVLYCYEIRYTEVLLYSVSISYVTLLEGALEALILVRFLKSLLIPRGDGSDYNIVIECTHKFRSMALRHLFKFRKDKFANAKLHSEKL